jgi:HEAT repeat protein
VLATERVSEAPRQLPTPEGRVDPRVILQELLPAACSVSAEVDALNLLAPVIADAAARAAQSSEAHARSMATALLDASGRAAFLPLTQHLDAATAPKVEASVERIARAVVEPFLRLAEHPAAEVRQSAVRWLASRPEPAARKVVLGAVGDADAGVQRTALSALSTKPDPAAAQAVASLLGSSDSWSLRRQAAQTLERMGEAGRNEDVLASLEAAALQDRYALVRDAAARALFAIDPRRAVAVLERLRDRDPEIQVKATARTLLDSLP